MCHPKSRIELPAFWLSFSTFFFSFFLSDTIAREPVQPVFSRPALAFSCDTFAVHLQAHAASEKHFITAAVFYGQMDFAHFGELPVRSPPAVKKMGLTQ